MSDEIHTVRGQLQCYVFVKPLKALLSTSELHFVAFTVGG